MIGIAQGWDVCNAVTHQPTAAEEGRLLVTPNGTSGFAWNVTPGFPNWGYAQETVTQNEQLFRDAIYWLTGLASGANILLMRPVSDSTFGTYAVDFLTRTASGSQSYGTGPSYGPWNYSTGLGCAVTIVGAPTNASWTTHDWRGNINASTPYDPYAYDLVIMPIGWPASNDDQVDAYLAAGGHIWSVTSNSAGTRWSRYGFDVSGTQQWPEFPTQLADVKYLCEPIRCPPLGANSYAYGIYTSACVNQGVNTMGGRSRTYGPAGLGSGTVNSGTGEGGQIGLWSTG